MGSFKHVPPYTDTPQTVKSAKGLCAEVSEPYFGMSEDTGQACWVFPESRVILTLEEPCPSSLAFGLSQIIIFKRCLICTEDLSCFQNASRKHAG